MPIGIEDPVRLKGRSVTPTLRTGQELFEERREVLGAHAFCGDRSVYTWGAEGAGGPRWGGRVSVRWSVLRP